jgi:hypothetical protein
VGLNLVIGSACCLVGALLRRRVGAYGRVGMCRRGGCHGARVWVGMGMCAACVVGGCGRACDVGLVSGGLAGMGVLGGVCRMPPPCVCCPGEGKHVGETVED